MSWTSFKEAANRTLNKKGIKPRVEESLILNQANKTLVDFLGDKAQNKIRAMYFSGNTLTVAVLDEELLEIFQSSKQNFLNELNKQFENFGQKVNIVKEINILS